MIVAAWELGCRQPRQRCCCLGAAGPACWPCLLATPTSTKALRPTSSGPWAGCVFTPPPPICIPFPCRFLRSPVLTGGPKAASRAASSWCMHHSYCSVFALAAPSVCATWLLLPLAAPCHAGRPWRHLARRLPSCFVRLQQGGTPQQPPTICPLMPPIPPLFANSAAHERPDLLSLFAHLCMPILFFPSCCTSSAGGALCRAAPRFCAMKQCPAAPTPSAFSPHR